MNRQLLAQTLRGCAPLLLWGVHFTLCYVLVGVQCSPALYDAAAPRWWSLAALSALALGLCAAMLWRAVRSLGVLDQSLDESLDDSLSLRQWAGAAGALLALVGIAWTSLPLLMLDGCG